MSAVVTKPLNNILLRA